MSRTLINWTGPYSPTATYTAGDLATSGGAGFISTSFPNLGNPLTDTAHWSPIGILSDATSWASLAHATVVTINGGGSGGGSKAVPMLTWPAPASIAYGTPLSAAQLNATANALGTFTYSQPLGAVLSAGTQTLTVTFTPLDTTVYTSATATVTLPVAKAVPAIAWPNPPSLLHTDNLSAIQLDATSSTAGTFSYSPASGTALPSGIATLTATFTPADPANYAPVTLTRSLTVTSFAPTGPPSIVQGLSLPSPTSPTAPVVFTLAQAAAVGNLLTVVIVFNPGEFDHDYLPPDNTWNVTLGGRTGAGAGSTYRVMIATHLVHPLDGLSFTFYPTPGGDDGHTTCYLFETAGASLGAQIAFAASPAAGNAQTTASLIPASSNSLVLAGLFYVYDSALPAGYAAMPSAPPYETFLLRRTAPTADNTTPVSTSFANYAPVAGISYQLVIAPGNATAAPVASPLPGGYDPTLTTPLAVTLTCATAGAEIRYTLDGSLPTSSSTLYTGPLSFDRTTQLNAIALASGRTPSGVVPYDFVVAAGTLLGIGLDGNWHGYQMFPNDLCHQPVDTLPLEPTSSSILALMATAGQHLGPDGGIRINIVDTTPGKPYTTPLVPISANIIPHDDDYGIDRCPWPIPPNVFIESDPPPDTLETDQHVELIDRGGAAAYGAWRMTYGAVTASRPTYYACTTAVIFDLTLADSMQHNYTQTTDDAGGFSVAELMPRWDEIQDAIRDGSMCLKHAIRMDSKVFGAASVGSSGYGYFQAPAMHSAATGRQNLTDDDLIWYGMAIRLEAIYAVSSYSLINQVLLNTMKKFGFRLADISDTSFTFNYANDPRFDQADILKLSQVHYTNLEVVRRTTILNGANYPRSASLVPVVQSFTASATSVAAGTPVTLSATYTNASFAVVREAGLLRSGTSLTVTPTATTTYHLDVNGLNLVNDDGTGDGQRPGAQLTVTVF